MKDYVIKVNDNPAHKTDLIGRVEAKQVIVDANNVLLVQYRDDVLASPDEVVDYPLLTAVPDCWASVDEEGNVKVTLPKTMVVYRGTQTASICRLTPEQLAWYTSINQVQVVGVAKVQYIKEMSDIDWEPNGKALYHQVHDQTPIDMGEDGTYTPTELHCVIA